MSLVILGMEMPFNCTQCPCSNDVSRYCRAANKYIPMSGNPDWCPLRPLPEKHGRLIDADEATRGSLKRTGKRLLAIDTAPTIVEAEGDG